MTASTGTTIAEAVAAARTHLAAHPEDAVSRDPFARARLDAGLRVAVEGPNGWTAAADMSATVGGTASAPSPGWLLRAAVASCDAVLIAMLAAEEGIHLTSLEAEVTSESDDRGLVGAADVPAGPLRMRLDVRIAAEEVGQAELEGLVERALRRSPVSEALGRVVPVEVSVHAPDGG